MHVVNIILLCVKFFFSFMTLCVFVCMCIVNGDVKYFLLNYWVKVKTNWKAPVLTLLVKPPEQFWGFSLPVIWHHGLAHTKVMPQVLLQAVGWTTGWWETWAGSHVTGALCKYPNHSIVNSWELWLEIVEFCKKSRVAMVSWNDILIKDWTVRIVMHG